MNNKFPIIISILIALYLSSKDYQPEAMAIDGFRITVKINYAGCDCDFDRTDYPISNGDWTEAPPGTIHSHETVTIKAYYPIVNNQTISGGFSYVCGEFTVGYDWERLANGNRHFRSNILHANYRESSGGPDYHYTVDLEIKSCD